MFKLTETFLLPETDEEFTYLELAGGIGELLETFVESIADVENHVRKYHAKHFAQWLVDNSQNMHRLGIMKVIRKPMRVTAGEPPGEKYHITFGEGVTTTLEITLPIEDNPADIQPLIRALLEVISHCEACEAEDV